jgi:hypothetical protein
MDYPNSTIPSTPTQTNTIGATTSFVQSSKSGSQSNAGNRTAVIIGSTIGAFAGLAILAFVAFLAARRMKVTMIYSRGVELAFIIDMVNVSGNHCQLLSLPLRPLNLPILNFSNRWPSIHRGVEISPLMARKTSVKYRC